MTNTELNDLRVDVPVQSGDVTIFGAHTLGRYTRKLLEQGFQRVGNEATPGTIYQIHGNKDALTDDQIITAAIEAGLSNAEGSPVVVLLHRPDEIQDRLPELKGVLEKSSRKFGLAFLGDMHVEDVFYDIPNAVKAVVPHGFFDVDSTVDSRQIVIGTHTTWGDMRSTDHTLRLLGEVFAALPPDAPQILGYIGGKPKAELDMSALQATFQSTFPDLAIEFLDVHAADANALQAKKVILVDTENKQPVGLLPTFNTQMYYYGNRVRTGESSGSLHSGVSVPVILEMNGSEHIEDLVVIRVPYNHETMGIESADFKQAAGMIIGTIMDGSYSDSLRHNLEQAKKFNNRYVARQYVQLFQKLADGTT